MGNDDELHFTLLERIIVAARGGWWDGVTCDDDRSVVEDAHERGIN